MAKNEVIALMVEGGSLRAVRYVPRGRDGWARSGGGVWEVDALPVKYSDEEAAETEAPEAEGGTLVESDKPLTRALASARGALGVRNVVLGVPLSKLLVKVIKLPLAMRDELMDAVTLQIDKLSPFSDEEMTVGYEVLSETETDLWVFAAAYPEAVYEELGTALEEAKLRVLRIDASALGWFRTLCGPCHLSQAGRRVVLMDPDKGWDLLVIDHGVPVLARGLGEMPDEDALIRELTLSLMNAELEAGECAVTDMLVVSQEPPPKSLTDKLGALTKVAVRHVTPPSPDGGVEGVALRTGEGALLDLTPRPWRDAVKAARLRKQVLTGVGAAVLVWALFMGAIFAGPAIYKQLTARVDKACRAHAVAYKRVDDTRSRVQLIESYADRSKSALELLRVASGHLPRGITLTGFNYRREDGVRITGEADDAQLVYRFKDTMTDDPLFDVVTLTGPTLSRLKHRFDVDAKFEPPPENDPKKGKK